MAYKISDDCISCGACAAECPVSAISEGDGKYTRIPAWNAVPALPPAPSALPPRNETEHVRRKKTGFGRSFPIPSCTQVKQKPPAEPEAVHH